MNWDQLAKRLIPGRENSEGWNLAPQLEIISHVSGEYFDFGGIEVVIFLHLRQYGKQMCEIETVLVL